MIAFLLHIFQVICSESSKSERKFHPLLIYVPLGTYPWSIKLTMITSSNITYLTFILNESKIERAAVGGYNGILGRFVISSDGSVTKHNPETLPVNYLFCDSGIISPCLSQSSNVRTTIPPYNTRYRPVMR